MTMQQDPEPTLSDILALDDEARAALPPEQQTVHIDAVRTHLEAERTAAVEAERTRLAAEQQSREDRERAENAHIAQVQEDIRFANDIDVRLASDDAAVRQQAQLDKQNAADRYAAGVSGKVSQSASATMTRVLKEHYATLGQLMAQNNQYPEFRAAIAQLTERANGNPLVAAIEYGKSLSAAGEYERGKEEGARAERIALGREGSVDMGDSTSVGGNREDYTNARWITEQRTKDPEWPFKMSSDGKKTNLQRQREALQASMRRAG